MTVADRYSRLVLWLKVALPLLALAIFSTLFFVAETLDPDAAIPFADVDVERVLRDQGVTKPSFGGVTSNGVAISLLAESIRPATGRPEWFDGQSLSASLDFPSGTRIDITSPAGLIDTSRKETILQGGAVLESSLGYTVRAPEITASMAEARVLALNTVKAEGPAGTLTAGEMELVRSDSADNSYLLVFKGGVRLLYSPENVRD